MTDFNEDFLDEECVDCNENANNLLKEIEEGLALMEQLQPGVTESLSVQDVVENNIVEIRDATGTVIAAVPEAVVELTRKSYENAGVNTKKWTYARIFRQANQFVENLEEQRKRVNEQNRNPNPKSTPEQSGIFEEGDTLLEEGLFRVDLNEDLLRQHQELCSELRQDSDSGNSEG